MLLVIIVFVLIAYLAAGYAIAGVVLVSDLLTYLICSVLPFIGKPALTSDKGLLKSVIAWPLVLCRVYQPR